MNIENSTLSQLLSQLSASERALIAECLRQGATWPDEARAVLRWLRRKLKRKARAGRR